MRLLKFANAPTPQELKAYETLETLDGYNNWLRISKISKHSRVHRLTIRLLLFSMIANGTAVNQRRSYHESVWKLLPSAKEHIRKRREAKEISDWINFGDAIPDEEAQ